MKAASALYRLLGDETRLRLATLLSEMETIRQAGIALDERLWVSPRCHVVMPYHPRVEAIYERAKGKASTGTTGRGMGPVYADKVSYNGIRLADLFDEGTFASKLRIQLELKNALLRAYNEDALDFSSIYEEKLAQFTRLRHVVREPFGLLQGALRRGAYIVLEGAQGALLDNDWGTYPFCTASTTLAGGAAAGLGIAPINVPSSQFLRLGPRLSELGAAALSMGAPRGSLSSEGSFVSGRLHGPGLLPAALDLVRASARVGIPVIGACGIFSATSIASMLAAGALAVQVDAMLWLPGVNKKSLVD